MFLIMLISFPSDLLQLFLCNELRFQCFSLLACKSCQNLLLPLCCCTAHSAKTTCCYVDVSQPWREGLHCATSELEPWPSKSSSILLPLRDQFILLQHTAKLKESSLKAIRRHGGFWSLCAQAGSDYFLNVEQISGNLLRTAEKKNASTQKAQLRISFYWFDYMRIDCCPPASQEMSESDSRIEISF